MYREVRWRSGRGWLHRGLCAELAGVRRQAEAVALRLLAEVQWTTGDEARARAQATAAALVAEFGLGQDHDDHCSQSRPERHRTSRTIPVDRLTTRTYGVDMTTTRHALTRNRLPIADAARAGLTRTDDEERASYARAALACGFRTVAAVANFVRCAAPLSGCDEAEAVAALRTVARTGDAAERGLALDLLRGAGALPAA